MRKLMELREQEKDLFEGMVDLYWNHWASYEIGSAETIEAVNRIERLRTQLRMALNDLTILDVCSD
jgi:hypothetical protein